MIKQQITVRNLVADYAFSGDASKLWFCEIVDSNLNTDGNPVVNYVRNGSINLTCNPRQLNAQIDVIFHESHEVAAVKKEEAISSMVSGMPDIFVAILSKLLGFSRYLAGGALGLVILSIAFATLNQFIPFDGFLELWQKFNAANGSKIVTQVAKDAMDYVNDPFYETEGVKEIEKRYGISFADLFVRITQRDAPEGIYMMKDVFVDENGDARLMDHDDATDLCESFGGFIPHIATQNEIFELKKYLTLSVWGDAAEWTSTAKSWSSDDYVINLKAAVPQDGMYMQNSLTYGDGDDLKLAARCVVLRDAFIEED